MRENLLYIIVASFYTGVVVGIMLLLMYLTPEWMDIPIALLMGGIGARLFEYLILLIRRNRVWERWKKEQERHLKDMITLHYVYECSDGFRTEDGEEAERHEHQLWLDKFSEDMRKAIHEEVSKAFDGIKL